MNKPRVSIGLPVYNGENYIREALESILSQTFRDWELIVSDNASTDATVRICNEYAQRDRRIRVERNLQNLGAAYNYDRVLALARGDYFKWIAHDDTIAPDFIETCVRILDTDPTVVGAGGKGVCIDANGDVLMHQNEMSMDSPLPSRRYCDQITDLQGFRQIFSVFRTDAVRNCGPTGRWGSCDKNLLARFALQGKAVIADTMIYTRIHPLQSVKAHTSTHARSVWFDPSLAGRIQFPRWSAVYDYLSGIFAYRMPFTERLKCLGYWMRHMHWRGLVKDLIIAALALAHRIIPGAWEADKIIDADARRKARLVAEETARMPR
jgi:glycosyltransferase involved in cell wall biosynthesis